VTDYRITHRTRYRYAEPVTFCQNLIHLTPRPLACQPNPLSTLTVTPEPAVLARQVDYFGNPMAYFALQEPHRELLVEAVHSIRVLPRFTPPASPPWETVRDRLVEDCAADWLLARQFAFESRYVTAVKEYREYALPSFVPGRPILDAALDLTRRLHTEFTYDPRATTIATPVRDVFRTRRGVCQDFAHLQLAAVRSLGLAARYVSGYLSTTPPPGKPRLVGADASHAWVSVFCGEAGWVDLDPTNNQIIGERHIVLAWGRDYDDVSPVKGVILGGGLHTVEVSVDAEAVSGG
jgi:transglutaminase-like putative cysteine protease